MARYSAIIIDDEPQAIEFLAEHIHMQQKGIQILTTYSSWAKAIDGLKTKQCDILFLDISINGKNGLDILKIVPDMACEIIFVTAYSNFAVSAIKFSPCGYVLKPIDEQELAFTIDKAIARIEDKRGLKQPMETPHVEKVGVFNNKGIDYIDVKDIIYFECVNQYTKIVTLESEFTSSYHLAKFSNVTQKFPFHKVHRSYIINLKNILRYETSGIVIMSNKKEIPVARSQRNDFLKMFDAIH